MHLTKTWIVLADGAKARVYAYQGPMSPLKLIKDGTLEHRNERSQDLVTTKRGRVFHSADGTRSAMERPTDPHEHEKQVFSGKVVEFLKTFAGDVERIILAAPPKVLGNMRQSLPDDIEARISAEINKDLTNIPDQQLPEHLQDVLNIEPHPRTLPESVPYAKP